MKIIRHPNSTGTLPGTELYTWQQINNATQETQTLVGPLYLSYLEYVLNLDQQNASRQLEQIGTLLTEQAKTWTIGTLPFANVRFYLENNSPRNGMEYQTSSSPNTQVVEPAAAERRGKKTAPSPALLGAVCSEEVEMV